MKILLSIVAVLAVVGGTYAISHKKTVPETPSSTVTTQVKDSTIEQEPEQSFTAHLTLVELLKKNGSHMCTFTEDIPLATTTGTIYISNSMMRGDFVTDVKAVKNMKVNSHMIMDGKWIYTWTSFSKQGLKLEPSAELEAKPSSQTFDYNQNLDYNCTAWTADSTQFTSPADITFKEMVKDQQ